MATMPGVVEALKMRRFNFFNVASTTGYCAQVETVAFFPLGLHNWSDLRAFSIHCESVATLRLLLRSISPFTISRDWMMIFLRVFHCRHSMEHCIVCQVLLSEKIAINFEKFQNNFIIFIQSKCCFYRLNNEGNKHFNAAEICILLLHWTVDFDEKINQSRGAKESNRSRGVTGVGQIIRLDVTSCLVPWKDK